MKKIYFATGNKQKLERMQLLCSSISDDFIIERVPNIIDVLENGKTAVDNAIIKILPYENLDYPVIA
jgi:inosine/xanthosine triphosphate pyrophosphatase family protein